ncbi:hypothetical protein E2C01_082674 [Portunus trituberculatus]|uniref:Uncharacterized protein n=1 Tax=Portunus trituberculatus TaxID=210409 RepID=A0A5B7ISY9_PORTR|nr:hypothetical protein [Portunus trituberculatus]
MSSERLSAGEQGKQKKRRDEEEEPVHDLDIKTLRECLGGIEKKALETLKEHDPNPASSSKVAHDVEKSVKIYQEIYDAKNKKDQTVLHVHDPATADPSTSTSDSADDDVVSLSAHSAEDE